jgi:hypothetical protein
LPEPVVTPEVPLPGLPAELPEAFAELVPLLETPSGAELQAAERRREVGIASHFARRAPYLHVIEDAPAG